ncbi:predicted protein [Naegleria gruberi]|uniref:Predicted protein n=1 Tax=Naegleria gruberi TaxID=5762 RepID=D2VJ98_NAEGR|nr:uncharacterized protein NAEGRDRAFT_68961 [Naegleria gruberi]EFC43156.1 predicted protein [Naegleria gruberi]|eukprot:XP_002675900.1 predicted protein [Naegleria gruberi strain NEG-M]
MGNVQEPAKPAVAKQQIITGCLSEFMKTVPIEIKLYTFSYVPMEDFPKLLLITKPLKNSILRNDEIFVFYYKDFRERALIEISKLNGTINMGPRLDIEVSDEMFNPSLPLSIDQVQTKSNSQKISKNYKKLQQVVQNHIALRNSIERLTVSVKAPK